jgi:hypothetical protein
MTGSALDRDEIEITCGAAQALRKCAERQARIAENGTTFGERGSTIRTGEAAIATRVALTLASLAAELEAELPPVIESAA